MLRDCYLKTSLSVIAVCVVSWFALRPFASNLAVTIALVGVTCAASVLACMWTGSITAADRATLLGALRLTPRSSSAEKPVAPAVDEGGLDE